jgi:phosphatidylglycerol:prolipoprotein diacylglycerol transferase
MHQILFTLPVFGGIPVYGYGVMLVIGFFTAMELAKFLARRSGLDPELFANAALIALVTGVVGARLSHVLENWRDYAQPALGFWQNLWNAVNIRSGGLTYYGGFLLAFPSVLAYGLYKRVPVRVGMDIIAPCLMIGLGFGRIGCYLNGCCYGAPTTAAWGVEFPYGSDAYATEAREGKIQAPEALIEHDTMGRPILDSDGRPVLRPMKDIAANSALYTLASQQHSLRLHPAQLYSTLTAWLIAAFLVAYFTLPHAPGRGFSLMLILEGITRFLLEMLRAEPPATLFGRHVFGPLTLSMGISVVLVVLGAVLWVVFGSRRLWKDIPVSPSVVAHAPLAA